MNEICVITGASRGLGKDLARVFAKTHNVCLIARNAQNLQSVKEELSQSASGKIVTFSGDISDEEFVKDVFCQLQRQGYTVKYLINNAGVGRFCKATENTRQVVDDVLSASLVGTILVTTSALPLMAENGTIAAIMSTAALKGNGGETAYCAAKWGERGYMEALKNELSATKLKIVSIFPGGIDTTFWTDNRHHVAKEKSDGFMNSQELAQVIYDNLTDKRSLLVRELVIERLK